jgi:CRISPR-associated protein (TIGR02710 family)
MAHEQPVQALVVALTQDLARAAYSINRLQPDSLCFVLPETAKSGVESNIQPQLTKMPRRWDWVLLSDSDSFPACYEAVARSLPPLLANWGIEPGTLVLDLTGATSAMAGSLTVVLIPYVTRIVSITGPADSREGEAVSIDGREDLWLDINPWDEAADVLRREGCGHFNRGSFAAAASVFRHIEALVSGGRKPLYHALADLADGYGLWERFQHRQAWDRLKAAAKAMEMATLFGGPAEVRALVPAVKANAVFLEKLVLDPADAKELLAPDLLAHVQRRLRIKHDPEGAAAALVRALEAFAQRQLFKQYKIKSWDAGPEQLPDSMREICRSCYLDRIDGKYKLPTEAQFRTLAERGDPLGQAFLKEWSMMKPLLDAVNHAVLGHGFEPIKAERVQQLYDVVVRLTGVSDSSLPKFPVLHL